jgi:NAD(P)-dependent dehydrogenase (short-subunit alcohol dehydrogenase family)
VINVSSVSGRMAMPGVSAYCSSKFAVEGLSESLRYELLPFGVYVSLVEPGTFKTDIFGANLRLAARANRPESPYYEVGRRVLALVEQRVARSREDPRDVATTVVRVATARRPRLRYIVGRNGKLQLWAQHLLPPRAIEELVLRTIGRRELG